MGKLNWVRLSEGKGLIYGPKSPFHDEGLACVFAIQLPNDPPKFGEFRLEFAADHTHYDIAIVSFGLPSVDHVGPSFGPMLRKAFSRNDAIRVEGLIRELLLSLRPEQPFPLHKHATSFTGGVHFEPGWVRLQE